MYFPRAHSSRLSACYLLRLAAAYGALLSCTLAAWSAEPLTWKFAAGSATRFKLTQSMSIDMGVLDAESTGVNQEFDLTWTVKDLRPDGSATISQKIDRIRIELKIPDRTTVYDTASDQPPQGYAQLMERTLEALTSVPIEFTMTPRGKVDEVVVPEELVKALQSTPGARTLGDIGSEKALTEITKRASLELPKQLEQGATWTVDTQLADATSGDAATLQRTYEYDGPRQVDGETMEVFKMTAKLEFGEQEADRPKVGVTNQESSGEVLFNRSAGRLQSSTLHQVIDLSTKGRGGEITRKVDQKVELRWVDSPE